MPGQPGQRRGGSYTRRHHQADEYGINPLSLFTAWLDGSDGFARPAPPDPPPLPLQFTCRACGEHVDPEASRCSHCDAKLYVKS